LPDAGGAISKNGATKGRQVWAGKKTTVLYFLRGRRKKDITSGPKDKKDSKRPGVKSSTKGVLGEEPRREENLFPSKAFARAMGETS